MAEAINFALEDHESQLETIKDADTNALLYEFTVCRSGYKPHKVNNNPQLCLDGRSARVLMMSKPDMPPFPLYKERERKGEKEKPKHKGNKGFSHKKKTRHPDRSRKPRATAQTVSCNKKQSVIVR